MTLLEIRNNLKIKQKPVMELMNINRKTLYRWEHLITAPDHWQLLKLCEYYGVKPKQVKTAKRYDPYGFLPWSTTEAEYKADCEKFKRETMIRYEENVRKPFQEMLKQWGKDGSLDRWKI